MTYASRLFSCLSLAALTAASVLAACSGDDDTGGGGGAGLGGAEAGAPSGGSSAGDPLGGAGHAHGGGSDAGGANLETAGAGGEVTSAGASGGGGAAGQDAGEAGAAGQPPVPTPAVPCPAVGATLSWSSNNILTDAQYEAAGALGCDLLQVDGTKLSVSTFQVADPSVFVAWATHSLNDYDETFRLDAACTAAGVVSAGPLSTGYPDLLTRGLEPGTYTSVTCGSRAQTLVEALPPAPTNVDCAHATPLTTDSLQESRIVTASPRYYAFTVSDNDAPAVVDVFLDTNQNSTSADATLDAGPFHATKHLPYALANTPLSFANLPANDYCLKIEVDAGTKYKIRRGI